jgi:exonuclease III
VDICCLQETKWKGDGTRLLGAKKGRYKLFWKGVEGGRAEAGVGVLIAETGEVD